MTTYHIWSEGYRCNGDFGTATFHGTYQGKTFKDACKKRFKKDKYYSKKDNTYWGCRLFSNETQARETFG